MRILTVRDITSLALVYRDDARQVTSYDVIEGRPAELPSEPEAVASDTFLTVESETDEDDFAPLHAMQGTRMVLPYAREYTVVVRNLPIPPELERQLSPTSSLGIQAWVRGDPHLTVLAPRLLVPSILPLARPIGCMNLTATAAPDAGAFMPYPTGADDQRGRDDVLIAAEVDELPEVDTHVSILL